MAFPSFPTTPTLDSLNWLNDYKLLASERTMYVDSINGDDTTGNGWGKPFQTIQRAIDEIVTQRGGSTTGQDGTANEWWAVSVAPGEYPENLTVYGWMVVEAQERRTVRVMGAGSGTCITLQGGGTQWAPCGLVGLLVSRDDDTMASEWAIDCTQYGGNGAGYAAEIGNAAFAFDCYVETAPLRLGTEGQEVHFKGIRATGPGGDTGVPGGFLCLLDCDLAIAPPGFPGGSNVFDDQQVLVENGAALYMFGGTSAWPESAPFRLNNPAWARDVANLPSTPFALALVNVAGGSLRVETSLDDVWVANRVAALGGLPETPAGIQIALQNAQIAQFDVVYSGDFQATDATVIVNAIGTVWLRPLGGSPDPLAPHDYTRVYDAIHADKLQLVLSGPIMGSDALSSYLNPIAGRNGPPFTGANFSNLTNGAVIVLQRDVTSKDTASYARTAFVTVGLRATDTEASVAFALGADFLATGTDDANPIQAALNLAATTGGVVQLGPGTYNLGAGPSGDAILSIPANVTLSGQGASTLLNCGDTESARSRGIELAGDAAQLTDLQVFGAAKNHMVAVRANSCSVLRVQIDASQLDDVASDAAGLLVESGTDSALLEAQVSNSTAYGAVLAGATIRATRLGTNNNANAGIWMPSALSIRADLLESGNDNISTSSPAAIWFGEDQASGFIDRILANGKVLFEGDSNTVSMVLARAIHVTSDFNRFMLLNTYFITEYGAPQIHIEGDYNFVVNAYCAAPDAGGLLIDGNSNSVNSLRTFNPTGYSLKIEGNTNIIGVIAAAGNDGVPIEITGDYNQVNGGDINFATSNDGATITGDNNVLQGVVFSNISGGALPANVSGAYNTVINNGAYGTFGAPSLSASTYVGYVIPAGDLAVGVPTGAYTIKTNRW